MDYQNLLISGSGRSFGSFGGGAAFGCFSCPLFGRPGRLPVNTSMGINSIIKQLTAHISNAYCSNFKYFTATYSQINHCISISINDLRVIQHRRIYLTHQKYYTRDCEDGI